jgi:hypothetical protein
MVMAQRKLSVLLVIFFLSLAQVHYSDHLIEEDHDHSCLVCKVYNEIPTVDNAESISLNNYLITEIKSQIRDYSKSIPSFFPEWVNPRAPPIS